ncbi:Uma2 family endonuclease [Nocardia puris]|uniref:Uma2 family endonuclease n=1 Tax=Nocardia puris TaxID=208602 RepID=A0A366DG50_9NOCA|nr:Uma2 family endonuclease [Nocardia puris]RBO88945.1 Uma2 family endonuclease [Nocardia puris]
MAHPPIERPDLPEYMTWEQLEQLPDEIAGQIELWEGKVVWLRRGPAEHQEFTNLMWSGLRRCAREDMAGEGDRCWRVHTETNVFLGQTGKSDFVTPDFLVHRCLPEPYQDVRADDVLLVGEVLSPSNTPTDMEAKKARYARAGIPWYWEVTLERRRSAIATVHAFVLETTHGRLPDGVRPLYPANYLLAGKWSPKDSDAIDYPYPFSIHVPWSELEF